MKKIDTYSIWRTAWDDIWSYEAPIQNPLDPSKFDYISSSVFKGTISEMLEYIRAYRQKMENEHSVTFDLEVRWPNAYNAVYSLDDSLVELSLVLRFP